LVGLTSLFIKNPPMASKLNRRRALFVLTKIDEILAWEARKEAEKDIRFVELGRYLFEVRADNTGEWRSWPSLMISWRDGSRSREERRTI
jgi:hypothetical protein